MKTTATELIVALDAPTPREAENSMLQLKGLPLIYKVGLELFLSAGPAWVLERRAEGHRIFLDLKLHDIPNTVIRAVEQICRMDVELFTFHATCGSPTMMSIADLLKKQSVQTRALAVSVLTSMNQSVWSQLISAQMGVETGAPIEVVPQTSVLGLAELAYSAGIRGLVCSPLEVQSLKQKYPDLYLVVPGIRLATTPGLGTAKDDQSRVLSPREAALAGADCIVMGRPILQSNNPRQVAEDVLAQLAL